uniref:Uncharacterized protein n=1 Tax=Rhizophora mucronata TaxID=61149 RepID=A0A2P2P950_RHIMU
MIPLNSFIRSWIS